MKNALVLISLVLLIACNSTNPPIPESQSEDINILPGILNKSLEAHGGLDRWQKMESLQFAFQRDSVTKERHQIDLKSRKTLITRGDVKVGFDGKDVWVSPDKAAFGKGDPRFYHSVYFYFYSIPFVLADPGIQYEVVPNREIDGKSCPGVKISYNAGIGDAPDDYYIAYFDPQTYRMYGLLYTVTYGDGKPNENYGALKYESWKEVNGLLVPERMVWYKFEDEAFGERRREKLFTEIKVSEEKFAEELFERKETSEVAE